VKHDVFIDGENMGISVIDAGHFYTENIFCEFIANELKNKFSDLRVEIAVSNRDIVEVI
jgi:putative NIF3 family GTP cyclohydrolase 1 type 2